MPLILLAEDDPLSAEITTRRLERAGFEVVCASTGRAAVEAARRELPDAVLMDMSLPEIDGWEATQILRSEPATAALLIVAVTAHAMKEDQAAVMDAGCDAYFTKPLDFERLKIYLRGAIGDD